jgi:hypothetical protein
MSIFRLKNEVHNVDLKLKKVIKSIEKAEAELWHFLDSKSDVEKKLREISGWIKIGRYELKKVMDVEHDLIKITKSSLAKEIEKDLEHLEKIVEIQIEALKKISQIDRKKISEILDGQKKNGTFSESSQMIKGLIAKLKAEEKHLH